MLEDLFLALLRKFLIKFVAAPKIPIIYNFRRKKIVVELARNWDSPRKTKSNRERLTWWRFQAKARAKVRAKVDKNLLLKALLSGNIDLFSFIQPKYHADHAIADQAAQISLDMYLPTLLNFSNHFSPSICSKFGLLSGFLSKIFPTTSLSPFEKELGNWHSLLTIFWYVIFSFLV